MASKAKATKGNGRKARRKKGEALPTQLNTSLVVRALDGVLSETEFTKRYDSVERKRNSGPREVSDTVKSAYVRFTEDGDFAAFMATTGLKEQSATATIGRLVRMGAAAKSAS